MDYFIILSAMKDGFIGEFDTIEKNNILFLNY